MKKTYVVREWSNNNNNGIHVISLEIVIFIRFRRKAFSFQVFLEHWKEEKSQKHDLVSKKKQRTYPNAYSGCIIRAKNLRLILPELKPLGNNIKRFFFLRHRTITRRLRVKLLSFFGSDVRKTLLLLTIPNTQISSCVIMHWSKSNFFLDISTFFYRGFWSVYFRLKIRFSGLIFAASFLTSRRFSEAV